MKKFAGKNLFVVAALLSALLGSQSVFASATSNTEQAPKVDGVMVITAHSQMFYVEAGRFIREYRKELISNLSSLEQNVAHTKSAISMFDVEPEQLAVAYKAGINPFVSDLSE